MNLLEYIKQIWVPFVVLIIIYVLLLIHHDNTKERVSAQMRGAFNTGKTDFAQYYNEYERSK